MKRTLQTLLVLITIVIALAILWFIAGWFLCGIGPVESCRFDWANSIYK